MACVASPIRWRPRPSGLQRSHDGWRPDMRLFVFARHAESSANALHLINSDPSRRVELTPRGQEQARRLGRQLDYLHIDRAVCTRFLRTRQTASIALENRRVHIEVESALDEFDAGIFD